MAPFHLPTSFKAFARSTKQDPVPSSPDSFHSPSAKLDEWHPVPAWPPERTDVDVALPLGRPGVVQPPTGDKSLGNSGPAYNPQVLRDFVLPPLEVQLPTRQVSKSAGNRSELLDRDQAGSELRRPSTAHAVRRPSDFRTHIKGGSSLSRLNTPPVSAPKNSGTSNADIEPYVPARRPPPPPIQIHSFAKPPTQNPPFQRSDTLPLVDIRSQRPSDKALPKSVLPAGIAARGRSNSASVVGSVGLRAPAPAPLKRTWEDIRSRPPKSDAAVTGDADPDGALPVGPVASDKVPFHFGTETTTLNESQSRVAHRSASSPSLTQSASLSKKPSIHIADSTAPSAAALNNQHANVNGALLDRKLTLGSFRRKHAQVAVPLSPVFSEDGKSISRKSDGKQSLEVPHDPYIPRSGDVILSPAFILASRESMNNMTTSAHRIASTLFPDGYSLMPASDGPRVSSDNGLEVPPHVIKPGGTIRQDSATLPQEFHFADAPLLTHDSQVQPQNGPSDDENRGVEAPKQQPGDGATRDNLDHHGAPRATEASVAVPTYVPFALNTSLLARPSSPQEQDVPDLSHLSARKVQPQPSIPIRPTAVQAPTTALKTAGPTLCRSSSDVSLRGSLSRSSSGCSQLSGTSSGGRASPLRKGPVAVAVGSSSPLTSNVRLRERLFDSTKRLLTGSRVDSVIVTPRHSASMSDINAGQRQDSPPPSAADLHRRAVPKIFLEEPGSLPAMTATSTVSTKGFIANIVIPSASSSSASEYSPASSLHRSLSRKRSAPLPISSDRPLRGSSSYTNLPFTSSNRRSTLTRGSSTRSRSASDGTQTPAAAAIIHTYTQPSPAVRPVSPIGESEGNVSDNIAPSGALAEPVAISQARATNTPSTAGFTSSSASPREKTPARLRRKRSHKSARAISKAIAAAAASSPCPTSGAMPESSLRPPFPPDTNIPAGVVELQPSEPVHAPPVIPKTTLSLPRTNARPGLPAGPRVRPTAGLRVNGVRLGGEPPLHPPSSATRRPAGNVTSSSEASTSRPKIDTVSVLRGVSIADSVDSPASPQFHTVPVRWKGMTLDHAKWTFTSQELQTMVGRAIKQSSAEVTAIRLLNPQVLDIEMPEEIDRLETERDEIKARYGHQVRLRKLLMRSLDLYIDGSDPTTARRLLNDLRDVSALCESLSHQLHVVIDQLAQINALREQHLSSALIMALHKLNAGFLRSSSEVEDLKTRLAKAQAESEDGWNKALELEGELDLLRNQIDNSLDGSVADDAMSLKGYPSNGRMSRVSQARKSSARVSKASLRHYSRGSPRSSTHSMRFASLVFPRPPPTFPPSYANSSPLPPVPTLPFDVASPSIAHPSQRSLQRESAISRLAPPTTALSTPSSAALALMQAQNEVLEMLGLSAIEIDNMPRHRRSHSQPEARLSGAVEQAAAMAPTRPTSLLIPSSPLIRRRMSDSFVKDGRTSTSTSAAVLQTDDYVRSNHLFRAMVSRVDTIDG